MNEIGITRIEDQNFRMLSCYHIANYKNNQLVFNKQHLKWFLKPLKEKEESGIFIKKVEDQAKEFLLKNLQKAHEIILWHFKNEHGTAYGIAFHKVEIAIFAFLLTPITSAEIKKIKSKAEEVIYLTGDIADLFITKKDFIQ